MKKIYVSYFFKNEEHCGISNTIIEYKNITKLNDIASIEKIITKVFNMIEVKIISWQKL